MTADNLRKKLEKKFHPKRFVVKVTKKYWHIGYENTGGHIIVPEALEEFLKNLNNQDKGLTT